MSTTASADDPVTLMDLDVEILAEVLSCLEARWRGAAVQTCKMFALLSSELALETTYLVSTVAQSVEEAQALGESVPAAPSVGVIFSNTRGQGGAQKGITKLVRSLPPAMHAIGGEVDTLVGTQSAGGADAASAPAPAAGAASSSANNGAAAQGPDDKEEEEEEEDEYSEMMMPAQWMVYQQQKRASKRLPRAAELMVRRETGIALTLGASAGGKGPSAQLEDSAPSARPVAPAAPLAPPGPGAQPHQRASSRRLPELAPGRAARRGCPSWQALSPRRRSRPSSCTRGRRRATRRRWSSWRRRGRWAATGR